MSKEFGTGRDLCGAQTYQLEERRADGELYPLPNWISFDTDERKISVQPDEDTEVGSYELVLTVSL